MNEVEVICDHNELLVFLVKTRVLNFTQEFVLFCEHKEDPQSLVEHAPPSTRHNYDIILIDECSQLDNDIGRKVIYAIEELPRKPFVAVAADLP